MEMIRNNRIKDRQYNDQKKTEQNDKQWFIKNYSQTRTP